MSFLPADLYRRIEQSVPITCVDFVPMRGPATDREVGLILRESPFGRVWCHLGGRVLRGETIEGALRRHAHDTLQVELDLMPDPQPAYVYQWFPPEIAPHGPMAVGSDPRKHAIALSFATSFIGYPSPRNEALDFAYFPLGDLPEEIWPGGAYLIDRLASSYPVS